MRARRRPGKAHALPARERTWWVLKWETHLRELHLAHEAHAEVLEDDAVGGGEEGENVRDEVLLIIGEVLPVLHVVGQVDLLGCRDGEGDGKCPG